MPMTFDPCLTFLLVLGGDELQRVRWWDLIRGDFDAVIVAHDYVQRDFNEGSGVRTSSFIAWCRWSTGGPGFGVAQQKREEQPEVAARVLLNCNVGRFTVKVEEAASH